MIDPNKEDHTALLVPKPEDMAQVGGWLEALAGLDLEALISYHSLWTSEDDTKLFRILVALGEVGVQRLELRGNAENLAKLRADATGYLVQSQNNREDDDK